jgi:hypothetical protein
MITNNLYKETIPKYSRISRIQRFLRSNTGFKIGIIVISLLLITLIELGLIFVLFLGDILGNDFLMFYAKQRMIFFNTNEVSINGTTNQWYRFVLQPLLFRFGFLSLLFGIIICILSIKTSTQSSFQLKKRFWRYLSLLLISLGIFFLIFPF